eukprot:g238.t1
MDGGCKHLTNSNTQKNSSSTRPSSKGEPKASKTGGNVSAAGGYTRSRLHKHIEASKYQGREAVEDNDRKSKDARKKLARPKLANRLQEARKAAKERVLRDKTRSARRTSASKKKKIDIAKLKANREEQLKKFRKAAAARNRERARKKKLEQAKIKAEAEARMKRLEELQHWLAKKKKEQRTTPAVKTTTTAAAMNFATSQRVKDRRNSDAKKISNNIDDAKATTMIPNAASDETTASSSTSPPKELTITERAEEIPTAIAAKAAPPVAEMLTTITTTKVVATTKQSLTDATTTFAANNRRPKRSATEPSSLHTHGLRKESKKKTIAFGLSKPSVPNPIRRAPSSRAVLKTTVGDTSTTTVTVPHEPARTVREILKNIRARRVTPRPVSAATRGQGNRADTSSPEKKKKAMTVAAVAVAKRKNNLIPDSSNRIVRTRERTQPQDGMVILRRRSDRKLLRPSTGGRKISSAQTKPRAANVSKRDHNTTQKRAVGNVAADLGRARRRSSRSSTPVNDLDAKTVDGGDLSDVGTLRVTISQRLYNGASSIEFYAMNRILGKGNFGIVRLSKHKLSGEKVAIKLYDKSKFNRDRTMRKQLNDECILMAKMNHPNVTRLFETFSTQRRIYMVMEYVSGGSLIQHMRTRYAGRAMPEKVAWRLFPPLFKGLNHIHRLKVCHRDIKLDNILLDCSGSILKFTDFGFSTHIKDPEKDRQRLFCGTPAYMAPEIIRGGSYRGFPVDIWAMGVVLYAVVCGRFPFMAKYERALYKKVVSGRFSLPSKLSKSLRIFLKSMLCVSTRQRLTMDECLEQQWVKIGASANAQCATKMEDVAPYIISNDPREDISDATLKKLENLGFRREAVKSAVLKQEKNQFTTSYYLAHAYTRKESASNDQAARHRHDCKVSTQERDDAKYDDDKGEDVAKQAFTRAVTTKAAIADEESDLPSIRPNRSKSEPASIGQALRATRNGAKTKKKKKGGIVVLTNDVPAIRPASRGGAASKAFVSMPRPKPVAIKYMGYYRALHNRRKQ